MKWFERFAEAAFDRASDLAHDLKTPLNIAVLNLELLRMRVQKLVGHPDDKLNEYSKAIDQELRRMARVFDAYFVYGAPPKLEEKLEAHSPTASLQATKRPEGWSVQDAAANARVLMHASRLQDLMKLLVDGVGKIFSPGSVVLTASTDGSDYHLRVEGESSSQETDFGKVFKFYYTDPSGNPDIAFATARLIAETYGGNLTLWDENGKRLVLDLRLPTAGQASGS